MKRLFLAAAAGLGLSIALLFNANAPSAAADPQISGTLVDGYRVLPVPSAPDRLQYTVYRGDYVKFRLDSASGPLTLSIPALGVRRELPADFSRAPYFKMKTPGSYPFELGAASGRIVVVEYRQPNYRELTADQAAVILANERPLLLDVRTPAEYQNGHIAGAKLIPVQELQRRLDELAAYKGKEILVYCATGNRSTVASKILIDNGFGPVLNMRRGIVDWARRHPVTR